MFLFPRVESRSRLEQRLFWLAAAFLILYSVVLTLTPAVRVHSWQVSYLWKHWAGTALWLAGYTLILRQVNRLLPDHDPYLLPIAALLSGWGLLTVYRLDSNLGLRQTIWLAVGFLVIFLAFRFRDLLRLLRRYKYIWLFSGLTLIVLTFFFGSYPGGVGPRLWLGCCGVYLQPSEPLKLLLIAYLAAYLSDQLPLHWNLPNLLAPTLVVAGAATALLIAQRDLGTATLLIVLYSIIIFTASGKRRILVIAFGVILIAAAAGYKVFDVIRVRINGWLNPWADPTGASYQIVQSLISIASGRLLGAGPGLGSPTLVPVAHSDFIGTAVSEEMGLLGITSMILLFCLLVMRGLIIAIHAKSNYQRYLAVGLSAYFACQAIFILGGNLRLLPLTGVTLPFVSYGGSSLVTAFFSVGILTIISSHSDDQPIVEFKPQPFFITSGLLLSGFLALTLLAGWWGVIRSEKLQFRPDNVRWTISERYVPRGNLLDRNNDPIAVTTGQPGSFQRVLLYPSLGNTIGYTHPIIGKAGLEATLDGYLTGLRGNPTSSIWIHELIYSQPPPGLDVRLSLDIGIQKVADEEISSHTGALVLLNASTGEILALSSHPSIDPSQIEEKYTAWNQDPGSPLLNRATQGSYPLGTTSGPLIYAGITAALPATPSELMMTVDGQRLTCSTSPDSPLTWESAMRSGCPGAISDLANLLSTEKTRDLFRSLGFYDAPITGLPAAEPVLDEPIEDLTATVTLGGALRVTPLQMALAAATITNHGSRPAARLAVAVETPHQGWVVLPSDLPKTVIANDAIKDAAARLAVSASPYWQTIGKAEASGGTITWFVAGTVPTWQGAPLALALVLEEDNVDLAERIGQSVMQAALTPQ